MKLTAYSVLSDLNEDACTALREVGINLTLASSSIRPDENELIQLVQKYDILIIGAKEKMTKKVFDSCTKAKIIGTLSVGLDHFCSDFLSSEKIKIINCPTSNTVSVAEHTFALLLSLKKKIIDGNNSSIDGSGRAGINGYSRDLFGSTIGVIGAGNIASEVIKIAQVFNMKILCFTRTPEAHTNLSKYGVDFVDLDILLLQSDIVTIHLPLNGETKNILDSTRIDLMKENATFINTSRAALVDVPYLLSRADKYKQFMIGMDIDIDDYKELISKERSNIIITPHIAGVSLDAILRMDIDLAKSICNVII